MEEDGGECCGNGQGAERPLPQHGAGQDGEQTQVDGISGEPEGTFDNERTGIMMRLDRGALAPEPERGPEDEDKARQR